MSRRRWASFRYARALAEVARAIREEDNELKNAVETTAESSANISNAIEVSNSDRVSSIANNTVVTVSNNYLTSTYTSNADFQSYVANTNPRFNKYLEVANTDSVVAPYLQVANAVSSITELTDVDISGATDGQVLTYNSSNGTITATTVSGGGGGGGITTGKAIAMAIVFG
jgi:hypothetical protein